MYRTPKPEEFKNGFHFEMYVSKIWMPCSYGSWFTFSNDFIVKGTTEGKEIFRVKI